MPAKGSGNRAARSSRTDEEPIGLFYLASGQEAPTADVFQIECEPGGFEILVESDHVLSPGAAAEAIEAVSQSYAEERSNTGPGRPGPETKTFTGKIGKSPYFQISADCTLKKGKFLIEGTAAGGEKQSFSPILAQPSTGDERKAKVLRDVVQMAVIEAIQWTALDRRLRTAADYETFLQQCFERQIASTVLLYQDAMGQASATQSEFLFDATTATATPPRGRGHLKARPSAEKPKPSCKKPPRKAAASSAKSTPVKTSGRRKLQTVDALLTAETSPEHTGAILEQERGSDHLEAPAPSSGLADGRPLGRKRAHDSPQQKLPGFDTVEDEAVGSSPGLKRKQLDIHARAAPSPPAHVADPQRMGIRTPSSHAQPLPQELAPEQQEPDAPQQPSAATRITTSASAPRSSRRIQGLEPEDDEVTSPRARKVLAAHTPSASGAGPSRSGKAAAARKLEFASDEPSSSQMRRAQDAPAAPDESAEVPRAPPRAPTSSDGTSEGAQEAQEQHGPHLTVTAQAAAAAATIRSSTAAERLLAGNSIGAAGQLRTTATALQEVRALMQRMRGMIGYVLAFAAGAVVVYCLQRQGMQGEAALVQQQPYLGSVHPRTQDASHSLPHLDLTLRPGHEGARDMAQVEAEAEGEGEDLLKGPPQVTTALHGVLRGLRLWAGQPQCTLAVQNDLVGREEGAQWEEEASTGDGQTGPAQPAAFRPLAWPAAGITVTGLIFSNCISVAAGIVISWLLGRQRMRGSGPRLAASEAGAQSGPGGVHAAQAQDDPQQDTPSTDGSGSVGIPAGARSVAPAALTSRAEGHATSHPSSPPRHTPSQSTLVPCGFDAQAASTPSPAASGPLTRTAASPEAAPNAPNALDHLTPPTTTALAPPRHLPAASLPKPAPSMASLGVHPQPGGSAKRAAAIPAGTAASSMPTHASMPADPGIPQQDGPPTDGSGRVEDPAGAPSVAPAALTSRAEGHAINHRSTPPRHSSSQPTLGPHSFDAQAASVPAGTDSSALMSTHGHLAPHRAVASVRTTASPGSKAPPLCSPAASPAQASVTRSSLAGSAAPAAQPLVPGAASTPSPAASAHATRTAASPQAAPDALNARDQLPPPTNTLLAPPRHLPAPSLPMPAPSMASSGVALHPAPQPAAKRAAATAAGTAASPMTTRTPALAHAAQLLSPTAHQSPVMRSASKGVPRVASSVVPLKAGQVAAEEQLPAGVQASEPGHSSSIAPAVSAVASPAAQPRNRVITWAPSVLLQSISQDGDLELTWVLPADDVKLIEVTTAAAPTALANPAASQAAQHHNDGITLLNCLPHWTKYLDAEPNPDRPLRVCKLGAKPYMRELLLLLSNVPAAGSGRETAWARQIQKKDDWWASGGLAEEVLCQVQPELRRDPIVVRVTGKARLFGDLHGQLQHLALHLRDLMTSLSEGLLDVTLVFIGDFVDRGELAPELMVLLFILKIQHPEKVVLLRGNHEAREMNKVTRCRGFDKCVKDRVKWRAHAAGLEAADGQDQEGEGLWQRFSEVFDWLPMAAIVNDKIFCVHGGPAGPDTLQELQQLEGQRPIASQRLSKRTPEKQSRASSLHQANNLLHRLLWLDPEGSSRRNAIHFTRPEVEAFLARNGFDLLVRGHQPRELGWQVWEDLVVTLFSAASYGQQHKNAGAVLDVSEDLVLSLRLLMDQNILDRNQKRSNSGSRSINLASLTPRS